MPYVFITFCHGLKKKSKEILRFSGNIGHFHINICALYLNKVI